MTRTPVTTIERVSIPPADGDRFDFGGLAVVWKIESDESESRFSVVEHPIAPRALAAELLPPRRGPVLEDRQLRVHLAPDRLGRRTASPCRCCYGRSGHHRLGVPATRPTKRRGATWRRRSKGWRSADPPLACSARGMSGLAPAQLAYGQERSRMVGRIGWAPATAA